LDHGVLILKSLLPSFVRTSRDLNHFWSYIKGQSGQWEPRRVHVRDAMTPLIDYLEGANKTPVDPIVSDVLQNFDADGVHKVWTKALERRHTDPEGAITSARTLLETVCKRVLDETGTVYDDKYDLPALYKAVATKLNIAPSQHTEETFKRILGGATSVVEGLGSLRNKIGDAHGHGKKAVRPSARHAQLAVNLAGTMATFIVETWNERKE
jgi:Abortive infection C-terminus